MIDIGDRRELLVDEYLVDAKRNVELRLHQPVPREVALTTDAPWEGNNSVYFTVFQDGDVYRMYYRTEQFAIVDGKLERGRSGGVCYAECTDGINWTKPELGLHEFDGSKANNIIWQGPGSHNFTPFKDANPGCPPEAKYKALGGVGGEWGKGLAAFVSPDGIHWSQMREEPVITQGKFDSQNLAFWDTTRGEYREYTATSVTGATS